MAFNIFSTLNQNLQNFGGDAYDAYQAGKSKVGNVASTINNNLQDFGGDLYDAGNQIKNNVSNFATQSVNTGKQVGNQIKNNVSNYATQQINEIKAIPSQIGQLVDNFNKGVRDANYNMWNSGLKSITGKNNSTLSDIVPSGEELSRNTGKADEEKISAFVSEIMKGGYDQDQALQILDATLAEQPDYFNKQTYGDKIRKTAVNRGREFGKTYQDFSTGKIGFGEATLRNAGDIVGLGGGVIGDTITQIPGVTPTLNAIGGAITSIPGVKPGMEAYGEFAKNNPRFAENAQAVTNLGLTALGSTEGQALMKQGTKAVGIGIKKAVTPIIEKVSPYTDKIAQSTGNIVGKTGETIAKPFKAIYNQSKIYTSSPDEVVATQAAIRPRSIKGRTQANIENDIKVTNSLIKGSGEVPKTLDAYVDATKKQMESIGKEINRVTGQDLGVDVTKSAQKIRSIANDTPSQLLDSGDAQKLLKLADDLDAKGKISVYEAEQMNQVINSMLKSQMPNAGEVYKRGLNLFAQDLRQGLDDAISTIPGEFKDIKKAYGALRNVYGDAVARQIVVNRANPSGLYRSFTAIEGASDIMSGLLKAASLDFKGGFSDIGKGLTKNTVGNFIITKNSPDNLISEAFKNVKGSKIPNIKTYERN